MLNLGRVHVVARQPHRDKNIGSQDNSDSPLFIIHPNIFLFCVWIFKKDVGKMLEVQDFLNLDIARLAVSLCVAYRLDAN